MSIYMLTKDIQLQKWGNTTIQKVPEAVARMYFVKKVFLNILQNSREAYGSIEKETPIY